MTDDPTSPDERRLDLRALDAEPDSARREAVIAAVLSRLAPETRDDDDITRLLRARRHMLAAAAALAGLAAATALVFPRRPAEPAADRIASWAQASHVPTNGELLAAFHGYTP